MKTLRERLQDWHDVDGAQYELGAALGVFPEWGSQPGDGWCGFKWVMWTDNPLGNELHAMLKQLVALDMLEFRNEPDHQYRWNPKHQAGGCGFVL